MQTQTNTTNTWLYMSFDGDITDSLGDIIPYPQKHFVNRYDTTYCWLLDGYFGTEKGTKYLNDIIARFILTFCNCKYEKHFYDTATSTVPLKLKAFQGLQSNKVLNKEYLRAHVQFDSIFWTLKYYAEDLIRENSCIIYQKLEDYAFTNFIHQAKDKSTLKAKCRSIWNWYEERDWEIGRVNKKFKNNKEELMASRVEHMKKINKKRIEDTQRKIQNCIAGLYSNEYKKPSGKWNIGKICEDTGLHRNTVAKHIATI